MSRAPVSHVAVAAVAAAMLVLGAGCSDAQKRAWRHRTPDENFRTALESELGDQRRDAVARIAESGYVASEDAFHVLDAVARTDSVQQIRCIAIRAFSCYSDDRPIPTLLAILDTGTTTKAALPAGDDLRWEAACTLLGMLRKDLVGAERRDRVLQIYIKLLQSDTSRNVRLISAEALGFFLDPAVFNPLISALRSEDFALADRAERSLIALTGETHDYDADAWEKWLAATNNPFANAGRTPLTTRPAGPTWFDRQMRAWRRGLKLRSVD